MDRVYRRQRYIYDFTRKYYLFGRDRLIARLALEAGRQSGGNGLRHGPQSDRDRARLSAKPGSMAWTRRQEMLETARIADRRAGLGHAFILMQGLAEHLRPAQFGVESFENVLFSYSLSMIPDWRAALAAGSRSLSPAGRLHVVDFGD